LYVMLNQNGLVNIGLKLFLYSVMWSQRVFRDVHTYVHINKYYTFIYVSSVAFETVAQTLKYFLSMSSYNHKNYNIMTV
jgi:hypothetical protein